MNLIFLQSEKHGVRAGFSGFCWLRERLNKSEPPSSRRQNCDEREIFQVGKQLAHRLPGMQDWKFLRFYFHSYRCWILWGCGSLCQDSLRSSVAFIRLILCSYVDVYMHGFCIWFNTTQYMINGSLVGKNPEDQGVQFFQNDQTADDTTSNEQTWC